MTLIEQPKTEQSKTEPYQQLLENQLTLILQVIESIDNINGRLDNIRQSLTTLIDKDVE
jgi:ferric iron reductase protein FhuF